MSKKAGKVANYLGWVSVITGIGALVMSSLALADVGTAGLMLSTIQGTVAGSVSNLSKILTDVSLVAGIGFVLASFFKFHQHKLNPTQVPISQGITLLLIGASLMVFPMLIPTAKNAVFGGSAKISNVSGSAITNIIGTGGSSGGGG